MKFERENRYLVFKRTDIETSLSTQERCALYSITSTIDKVRKEENRRPFHCVVVEDDWPEFEPTWNAIQKRVEQEQITDTQMLDWMMTNQVQMCHSVDGDDCWLMWTDHNREDKRSSFIGSDPRDLIKKQMIEGL